jgi:hypothetical protein
MNCFISRNDQQYGPYTLADLQRYVADGGILVSDLTRSEGMTEWVPVSQRHRQHPCPRGGRASRGIGMVEGRQQTHRNPRGDASSLLCQVRSTSRRRSLAEELCVVQPVVIALLLILGLIGIFVYIIVYYSARKQMMLIVPLCEEHRRARRTKLWVGSLLLITSPLLMVIGAIVDKNELLGLGLFSFLVMAIGGAVVLIQSQPLRPKKIDDQQGFFVGAREPFLQFIDSRSQSAFGTSY